MLPGRPFGNEDFVSETAERFGRYGTRGGPKKKQALARPAQQQTAQFTLFLKHAPPRKIAQLRRSPFPQAGHMGQLTVRNVPDHIVRALRIRAARNGRSAEAEHRLILAELLRNDARDFWMQADALRARTPRQSTDSGKLQREMRDER